MGAFTVNDAATENNKARSRAVRHIIVLALIIIALALAGKFNLHIPAAAWFGPIIIVGLFLYGAWILLCLGPLRS